MPNIQIKIVELDDVVMWLFIGNVYYVNKDFEAEFHELITPFLGLDVDE